MPDTNNPINNNPVNNTAVPNGSNPNNQNKPVNTPTPVNGAGVGIAASILKPQSEKDRKEFEKALERKKRAQEGGSASKTPLLLLIVVIILGVVLFNNKDVLKKAAKKIVSKPAIVAQKNKTTALSAEVFVLENNLRIKITTAANVDKASILLSGNPTKYEAKVISKENPGEKIWEVTAQGLKKGEYTYKCYAKDNKTKKLEFTTGTFTVK